MNVLQQREELSRGLLGGGYAELTEVQRSVVDLGGKPSAEVARSAPRASLTARCGGACPDSPCS